MELKTITGTDAGEWFSFRSGKGEAFRLKVRAIPTAEAIRIERKNLGPKRIETRDRLGNVKNEIEPEAQYKVNLEKAIYALVDTESVETRVPLGDEAAYREAFADKSLEANALITLDGHWNQAVKELVLPKLPPGVIGAVVGCSLELTALDITRDESKG